MKVLFLIILMLFPVSSFAVPVSIISAMTSNNSSGQLVTSSHVPYVGYEAYLMFDKKNINSSFFYTDEIDGWVQIVLSPSLSAVPSYYTLTSLIENSNTFVVNSQYFPSSWVLQAYCGGVWSIVDSQSNVSWQSTGQTKSFPLSVVVSCTIFKLTFIHSSFGRTGISEFDVFTDTDINTIRKLESISNKISSLNTKVANMDPITITQSISFLLGSFTALAFVMASNQRF